MNILAQLHLGTGVMTGRQGLGAAAAPRRRRWERGCGCSHPGEQLDTF